MTRSRYIIGERQRVGCCVSRGPQWIQVVIWGSGGSGKIGAAFFPVFPCGGNQSVFLFYRDVLVADYGGEKG